MSFYKFIFPKKHTLLIVVHAEGKEQALRNACIARQEGADGIFLINHKISASQLLDCYTHVKRLCSDFWIGLNFLDLSPAEAIKTLPKHTSGLWVDDAGIREGRSEDQDDKARNFAELRRERGGNEIYFGGVAFKYQREVQDPALAAKLAMPYVDVITTSGKGTGIAAEVEKIRLMKKAIGDHPLVEASGITPENVEEHMPYTDGFLVSTGVSDSHTELNSDKVRKLARIINR